MRGKRAKKYKKLMRQYELQFGFREPYQVLLDSAILQDTAKAKIDLVNRLQGVLGGEIKPMISQCSMRHLYAAKDQDHIHEAQRFERRRCGHHELEEPLSDLECIKSCVDPKDNKSNKHRVVVATQDPQIRHKMRAIPGVPLVYVNKSVMILEPLSTVTETTRERDEKAKFKLGLKSGRNAGEKRKREAGEDTQEQGTESIEPSGEARPQKKKRAPGPKQPNPLSMKKSTKKQSQPEPRSEDAAKSKSVKADPQPPVEDAGDASGAEGGEGTKRKRKRKHKSKGDGEAAAETEGDKIAVEAEGDA